MSTARQWRQYDRDRADAELIRRAAAWLRENPERAQHAGLSCDTDAHALAALLDVLAAEIAHLDSAVRCRAARDDGQPPDPPDPPPMTCPGTSSAAVGRRSARLLAAGRLGRGHVGQGDGHVRSAGGRQPVMCLSSRGE